MFCLVTALASVPVAAGMLEDIATSRELRVCIWPDYFGISYRNPRTGNFQGLDIDLSQALAHELGVGLKYIETDFSRVIDDVAARRCHIAMMAVGITPQRAARVDFSRPYLRSDVYAVTTRSHAGLEHWEDLDQAGNIIVVLKGTVMEPLMQTTLRHATVQVVTRPGEREREVESGRADAFMTDYPYSQRMLMNTDWARVLAPPSPLHVTDYAYAVPQGEREWLARVDVFVSQVKRDGRLAQAARPHNLLPIVVGD